MKEGETGTADNSHLKFEKSPRDGDHMVDLRLDENALKSTLKEWDRRLWTRLNLDEYMNQLACFC
jgi:hypothetical protein